MRTLSSFLERFRDFTPPSLAVARAVVRSLREILGITISESAVTFSHGVVRLSLGGAQKTEVILHKDELLAALRPLVGDSVRDII